MTKGGGLRVTLALIAFSLSGYAILIIAARRLNTVDNAYFLLFWALLFGCYGILAGIAQESTRAATAFHQNNSIHSGKKTSTTGNPPLLIVNGLFFGLALGLALFLTSPLWENYFAIKNPVLVGAFLICSIIGFACHSALLGAVTGRREWGLYSLLLAGEGAVRLVGAGVVALFLSQLTSFEIAVTFGGFIWLILSFFSQKTRRALTQRADVPPRILARNTVHAIISSSSTALLVVGFPLLLRITSSAETYAQSAALLLAVSITRAPLMLPLTAFQNILVAYFMRAPEPPAATGGSVKDPARRAQAEISFSLLLKPLILVLLFGFIAAVAAWFLGPFVMLVFGSTYDVDSWVMAALTLAGALIAILTLTGTAALAANRHGYCAVGWALASIVSVAVLLLSYDAELDVRVASSLIAGPLVGALVHLCVLAPRRRSSTPV